MCIGIVPGMERGVAWNLRIMGCAGGRGLREGPAPQGTRKISSQCSGWRQHGEGRRGMGESGVMKKDQREQSELFVRTKICN
jgi:hypothetical protein